MAKRDTSAEAWEAITALRRETDRSRFAEELNKHLSDKSGVVVGKAAQLGLDRQGDLEPFIDALSPVLSSAFDRLMVHPVKTDPGCSGKLGVVNLGVALHCLEADVYLRAIRHVQMEGSFGPPIDTAEAMRAAAAYGLLNVRHGDAMYEIVELLCEARPHTDSFPDSTRGAIRALGTIVSETSAALLRMTARYFDSHPEVLTEVFASLNSIEPSRSFDFIRRFLASASSVVADIAALALAESKQPSSSTVLLEHARFYRGGNPHALFTALAITRKPEAIEHVLDRLGNAREAEALAALEALHLLRHDAKTCQRIGSIVSGRGGVLQAEFQKWA